ncbi:MAG: hypothetical protein H6562_19350 [Lewinellaceae bacterium]|nr:hypothetical protein [Lewinellaceae bacterium]
MKNTIKKAPQLSERARSILLTEKVKLKLLVHSFRCAASSSGAVIRSGLKATL